MVAPSLPPELIATLTGHQLAIVQHPSYEHRQLGHLVVPPAQPLGLVRRMHRRADTVGNGRTVVDDRVHEVQRGAGDRRGIVLRPRDRVSRRRGSPEAELVATHRHRRMDVEHPTSQTVSVDQVLDACHVVVRHDDVSLEVHEQIIHRLLELQLEANPFSHCLPRLMSEGGLDVPGEDVQLERPSPRTMRRRQHRIVTQVTRQIVDNDTCHLVATAQLTAGLDLAHGALDDAFHVALPSTGFHQQTVAITFADIAQRGEEQNAEGTVARQVNIDQVGSAESCNERHDVAPKLGCSAAVAGTKKAFQVLPRKALHHTRNQTKLFTVVK